MSSKVKSEFELVSVVRRADGTGRYTIGWVEPDPSKDTDVAKKIIPMIDINFKMDSIESSGDGVLVRWQADLLKVTLIDFLNARFPSGLFNNQPVSVRPMVVDPKMSRADYSFASVMPIINSEKIVLGPMGSSQDAAEPKTVMQLCAGYVKEQKRIPSTYVEAEALLEKMIGSFSNNKPQAELKEASDVSVPNKSDGMADYDFAGYNGLVRLNQILESEPPYSQLFSIPTNSINGLVSPDKVPQIEDRSDFLINESRTSKDSAAMDLTDASLPERLELFDHRIPLTKRMQKIKSRFGSWERVSLNDNAPSGAQDKTPSFAYICGDDALQFLITDHPAQFAKVRQHMILMFSFSTYEEFKLECFNSKRGCDNGMAFEGRPNDNGLLIMQLMKESGIDF